MKQAGKSRIPRGDAITSDAARVVSRHKAVFTQPPERIPSDSAVDGPLLGNGDMLAALGGRAERLSFHINKNDLWVMRRDKGSHPVPLARLGLDFPELEGASYRIEQDLLRALTTGSFTKGGKTLTLEAAVAATENLLWVKLSAARGAISARVALRLPEAVAGETEQTSGLEVVQRRFEEDVIVPAGAACALRLPDGRESFVIQPGRPVLLAAVVASRFDADDFRAASVKRAAGFSEDDLASLAASHEAWWRDFWSESFVEVPDPLIEQRYYLSQYVLASASRARDFPPGLFGWVTTDSPTWCGDYHTNYNHVAAFYGLYAANHLAQADPCHAPLLANRERAAEQCRRELGVAGLYQVVGLGPLGSIADPLVHMQKSNSAYSCVPLAFRWYATYDAAFGREAYPFVRDTASFWENWLVWENGRYLITRDAVHEGSGDDVNSLVSLALVRMVMGLAIDLSRELGVDPERRPAWEHILAHLSDYPTCTVRDLPPKYRPAHLPDTEETLDLPIFRYTEKGTPWWDSNTLGIQHIYPAGGIGLDTPPGLLNRARNQIRVLNRWIDFNGMNSFYAAAARVGYDPEVILRQMSAMLAKLALPNGMIRGNPHGMEHQSIVPNALQEMLLQSHDGVLRLFPCWPRSKDACFGTLRARGAFLVSARLQRGVILDVRIVSEKGRPCTLVNPWPGSSVTLTRDGRAGQRLSGDRFSFATRPGERLALAPQEEPPANPAST